MGDPFSLSTELSCLDYIREGVGKMIPILLSFVLAVGVAAEKSQNVNPKPSADPSHAAGDASLPHAVKPEDPGITGRGGCKSDRAAKAGGRPDCKTTVYRERS